MSIRYLMSLLVSLCCCMIVIAGEMQAFQFAKDPPPLPGQLLSPRIMVANPQNSRLYVLDSGLARIVALTPDGQQVAEWPLASLGVQLPLSSDPVLPNPALAVGGGSVYLLNINRDDRQVDMLVVDGVGKSRTVVLPINAVNSALTVDTTGHLVSASLLTNGGKAQVIFAREDDTGVLQTIGSQNDPCDGQVFNLNLTGFVIASDGRLAVGIAQKSSNPAYSFIRSWLVQGQLKNGSTVQDLRMTHSFSLLGPNRNVQERYRASVTYAGRRGYPDKPCVPLFTSLVIGPDKQIVSGGHTVDPFLRIYGDNDTLVRSVPLQAVGGEHVALLTGKSRPRLFATTLSSHRIVEYSLDGRAVGGIGVAASYDLSHPVAITADNENVYVMALVSGQYHLVRFTPDGQFCWAQFVSPPAGMASALPFLAITASERVLVGWRMPKANGLGWVDTIMSDGLPGTPLWPQPYTGVTPSKLPPCTSPMITGNDGHVYVLREMKGGARLHAYSPTGAFLQIFPASLQGVTSVTASGNIAWVGRDSSGVFSMQVFSSQGSRVAWNRIPRATATSILLPAQAGGLWGWLTTSGVLLKFDESLTAVDDYIIKGPNGKPLQVVDAVSGDGGGRIYLAVPDQILMVEP